MFFLVYLLLILDYIEAETFAVTIAVTHAHLNIEYIDLDISANIGGVVYKLPHQGVTGLDREWGEDGTLSWTDVAETNLSVSFTLFNSNNGDILGSSTIDISSYKNLTKKGVIFEVTGNIRNANLTVDLVVGTCEGAGCNPSNSEMDVQETDYGYGGTLGLIGGASFLINIYLESEDRLHITIKEAEKKYNEIPYVIQLDEVTKKALNTNYKVEFPEQGAGFTIRRKSSGEVVFETLLDKFPIVLGDKYIKLTTTTGPNPRVYGWGERRTRLALKYPFNYTLHNQDRGTPDDGSNQYGSHPFHIEVLSSGAAHGILFLNSYPLSAELTNGHITYRSMGGYLDFYVFLGPDMKAVVGQYTELVGRPVLQPQWVFGFHQCHYGYESLSRVQEVVATYEKNELPLDVMWADIDYMREYRLFTTDPDKYPQAAFNDFINQIRQTSHKEFVVIVDPGIKVDTDNYGPYDDLLASGAYIRNSSGKPFIGKVWPGYTLFPDFSDVRVDSAWGVWIKRFLNDILNVSGLWLDMNEVSNFCNGECGGDIGLDDHCEQNDQSRSECYPWRPVDNWGSFMYNGIPLSTQLLGGSYAMYNNLFGYLECIVTRKAMKQRAADGSTLTQRQFILTRATFTGSGHNSAMWLGDNSATWADFKDSIAGVITAGLFGVSVSGVDCGGFINCAQTTENLHIRWVQAGAVMYPFFRDHSDVGCSGHELYKWGEPTTTIMRHSLQRRQRIQSYIYTLHHVAHRDGTPILRPLVMEFPKDSTTTFPIDTQAMLGPALLISPVLEPDSTTARGVYFPPARWYLFDTGAEDRSVTGGSDGFTNITNVDIDSIPIHVRGGTVHTQQEHFALATVDMKDTPLIVVAALDEFGEASGEIYVDDGITDDDTRYTPSAHNPVLHVAFSVSKSVFQSTLLKAEYSSQLVVEAVRILGVSDSTVSRLTVLANDVDMTQQSEWTLNATTHVLTVKWKSGADQWRLSDVLTIRWTGASAGAGEE